MSDDEVTIHVRPLVRATQEEGGRWASELPNLTDTQGAHQVGEERDWIQGCPKCGAGMYVKNAAVVRQGGSCDNCRSDGWVEPIDGLVVHELGWCSCGDPWAVDRWMLEYLTSVSGDQIQPPKDDRATLLAYMADSLGWTEHGVGIRYAWLTVDGKEAMANLARRTA